MIKMKKAQQVTGEGFYTYPNPVYEDADFFKI
jgi:hypothetical protein